jgi:hypothetical protein
VEKPRQVASQLAHSVPLTEIVPITASDRFTAAQSAREPASTGFSQHRQQCGVLCRKRKKIRQLVSFANATAGSLMPAGPLQERFPPGAVVRVPIDGGIEALLEVVERFPLQLALGERRIDGVTAVVAEPIGHVTDQALGFAELFQDRFHRLDIRHLAVATEIVNGARLAFEQRGHDPGAMVLDVDPVAHIRAVAVNREAIVAHGVDDHEGDQFFGELIRPVVVRATGDDDFLAEGFVAGQRDQVGPGFARGIGRARLDRRLLGEPPRFTERPVHFVGRDLDKPLDAVAPGAIEQDTGPNHIGVDEILGIVDAAVDVRFSGEIHDRVKRLAGHERVHLVGVRDIGFEKIVTLAMFLGDSVQVREISGVREDIDISHRSRLVMFQNIPNKVAPDEATATGHQYAHRCGY